MRCPKGSHWSDYAYTCVHSSTPWWYWLLLALGIVAVVLLLVNSIRIVQASENGVVFRLGQYARTVDPGPRFKFPLIERMEKVSMMLETVELDPQQVIANDSVSLKILAVVYYKVTNAADSIIKIDDVEEAIARLAPAIMRRVIGKHSMEDVLSHNENVDNAIKSELEDATKEWGVQIDRIELQDIQLPDSMTRAMAAKAEAQREAEAKVIASDGELKAAVNLQKAAEILSPTALELRRLATWREIGMDNATIIVVPESGQTMAGASAAGALAAAGS